MNFLSLRMISAVSFFRSRGVDFTVGRIEHENEDISGLRTDVIHDI
jgi:hypothetical protein